MSEPFINDAAFSGKYEFLEAVGAGGMGIVYKAKHLLLNRFVAIKMVHSHLVSSEVFRRFQIEGTAVGMLSHPYIIKLHDFGTTGRGQPFMVMDFIQGRTLGQVLEQEVQLSKPRFLQLFLQVCTALQHAHQKQILHRDIKPSNIMLVTNARGEEEVRLMDFGIAKLLGDTANGAQHLTKTGEAIGSPDYMSPEQARGMKLDTRSDLYSLGCVMYEALTGTPPFVGSSPLDTMMMHMSDAPIPLQEASLGQTIDEGLETTVLRLLEKEPVDRLQTIDEVIDELEQARLRPDLPSSRTSPIKPSPVINTSTTTQLGMPAKPVSGRLARNLGDKDREPKTLIYAAVAAVVLAGSGLLTWTILHKPAPKPDRAVMPAVIAKKENSNERVKDLVGARNDAIAQWSHVRSESISLLGLVDSTVEVPLTKAQLTALVSPTVIEYVRALEVGELGLTDDSISPIGKLELESLDATKNPLKAPTFLKTMKTLVFLNLAYTELNADAFSAIANLPNLQKLDVCNTPISDSDLLRLRECKSLTVLNIGDCKNLTPTGIKTLQKAKPDLIIQTGTPLSFVQASLIRLRSRLMERGKWAQADLALIRLENMASQIRKWSNGLSGPAALPPRDLAEVQMAHGDCEVSQHNSDSARHYYVQGFRNFLEDKHLNNGDPIVAGIAAVKHGGQELESIQAYGDAAVLRKRLNEVFAPMEPLARTQHMNDEIDNLIAMGRDYDKANQLSEAASTYHKALLLTSQAGLQTSTKAVEAKKSYEDVLRRQKM